MIVQQITPEYGRVRHHVLSLNIYGLEICMEKKREKMFLLYNVELEDMEFGDWYHLKAHSVKGLALMLLVRSLMWFLHLHG